MIAAIPTSCITRHSRTHSVQSCVALTFSSLALHTFRAWHATCYFVKATPGSLLFQPPSYQPM